MNSDGRNSDGLSQPPLPWLRVLCYLLTAYALAGGIVSFAGWPLDLPALTDWIGSGVSIQPNTAFSVIAIAVAFFLVINRSHILAALLGTLVTFVGFLTVYQIATDIDLGIDRLLLFGHTWGQAGTISLGRMGRPSAVALVLLGPAIVLLAIGRKKEGSVRFPAALNAAVTLAVVTFGVALLSLVGFLYGSGEFYLIPRLTSIAIQTATFLMAIALAIVLGTPETGPGRLLNEASAAGRLFRWMLPAVVLVSIIIGILTLEGVRRGFYDATFAEAARTIVEIFLLLGLLWMSVRSISRYVTRLEANERRLETLADAMPQLVWISDADGNVTYFNRRSDQYGELSERGSDSYNWEPVVHPDDVEETVDKWKRAASERSSYEHEHRLRMADGAYRWHLSRGVPSVDIRSGAVQWFGTATDIHELKLAQEALRQTEDRLQSALDAGRVGIWEYCGRTKGIFLDARIRGILGLDSAEPLTSEVLAERFIAPDELSGLQDRVAALLDPNSSGSISIELRVRRSDGGTRWLHVIGLPVPDDSGLKVFLRGTAVDITDRKRNEADQTFLLSIAEIIRISKEPLGLLHAVSEAVGKHLDADRCVFQEIDTYNDRIEILEQFLRDPRHSGFVAGVSNYSQINLDALKDGRAVVVRDARNDERTAEYFDRSYGPNHTVAYIVIPLMREGRWASSFWCSDDKPRNWSDDEVGLLEAVAERTWAALERIRAENALRESEERFKTMANGLPLSVWVHDSLGNQQFVNKTFCEFFGVRPEEMTGDRWQELIDPADRQSYVSAFIEAIEKRQPFHFEAQVRASNGTSRWVESWGRPRLGFNNEFLGMVGASVDITDRKIAEERLRESEVRFRNVSDSAPVLIWIADTENRGTWFNRPWLEFTGRSLEDEIGFGWLDSIHPDDRSRAAETCSAAFERRETFTIEFRLLHRTGGYRWVKDTGVPRFDTDGRFLGYIGSCIDITENRLAMDALRASEARLSLAASVGRFGMWDIDYTTEKMIWSDRLFEIFGLEPSPDHWVDMERFETLVHPAELHRIRTINDAAIRDHKDYAAEYRIVRASDGEVRWINARAQFFYDDKGQPIRSVGIALDVTEHRLAAEAVKVSENRLKLAQDAANIGVWEFDAVTDRTYWSEQMWKLYGEKPGPETVPNDFWTKFLHPDDREHAMHRGREQIYSGRAEYRNEFRIVHRSGDVRWIEAIARIERDGNGRPTRMYGVNIDLTDRRLAAERLRVSEANLRVITDSIPALISYIDANERYRFVNRKYEEWFDVRQEDILGKSMRELLGETAYKVFRPYVEAAMRGEEQSFDTWASYKNAGTRYVHVSYVPDHDLTGSVSGFYVLVTDLSELRRSEDLLRSSEERMRLLSESFTDYAIVTMDVVGRIESWNPGATNIFGWNETEAIGQPGSMLFTPEDVEQGVPQLEMEAARATGRAIDERWHVKKDGSRFFASGVMAPMHVGGQLTGYAKIASDLTERKRHAEELQRAHDEMEMRVVERTRELAEMNQALLSEINERKTAERQKIELLQRLVSTQEDERKRIARDLHDQLGQRLTALRLKLASLKEACGENRELAERAGRLQQIAQMLDSEVSFLTWELRPTALDELGLVEAIATFVKEWSRHYEIHAEFHASGLAEVEWRRDDEIQLYRIAQEALNNIVKHAEATRVGVLLERSGDNAMLIIEDNGKGFEPSTIKISDKSPRGFGLAGMRERAELIGGELELETAPDRGTTIYVRVPLGRMHQD